jgi:hypothetical protein
MGMILSQFHPILFLTTSPFKIPLNASLSLPQPYNWTFSKRFPNQNSECIILFPLPRLLQTPGFHYPKTLLSDLRKAPRYVTSQIAPSSALVQDIFWSTLFAITCPVHPPSRP